MANLDYHGLSLYDSLLDIDKAKAASLAPEFDSTADYAAGDYVMRTGVLYQFTAAHSAGSWTGDDAETVQLAPAVGALQDLKALFLGLYPQREIDDVAIATFSDGADEIPVKKLVADITPVQDLHGYDNPWPGGAGANRWDEEWEVGAYNSSDGSKVPANGRIRSTNYIPVLPQTSYYITKPLQMYFYGSNKDYLSWDSKQVGAFTTPEDCYFMRFNLAANTGETYNHDIAINYPDTVTTYSPYSNICPISGFTGANAYRTGFNMWDPSTENTGKTLSANGTLQTNVNCSTSDFISVKPGKTYYFKNVAPSANVVTLAQYDITKTFIKTTGIAGTSNTPTSGSVTMEANTCFVRAVRFITATEVCVNLSGSRNGDYEPYTNHTVAVSWEDDAGTVYGGALVLNQDGSADLTVDRAYKDMATISWSEVDSRGRRYQALPNVKRATDMSTPAEGLISEKYQTVANNTLYNNTDLIGVALNDNYLYVRTEGSNTPTGSVVYKLATPLSYHITGVEDLTTILGLNNIWADTGDIAKLIYRASLQSQLDAISTQLAETVPGMIAGVEDDFVATRNYTAGDYFVVNQVLYKATANIANGAALTPAVNCSETTVGAELVTIINS